MRPDRLGRVPRLPRVTGWRCPTSVSWAAVNGNLCDVGVSESVRDVWIRRYETDIESDLVK